MLGHPGKKLLFMGQEFAQLQEWSEARELDWYLLGAGPPPADSELCKGIASSVPEPPALYQLDTHPDGFQWINANDGYRSIFSFMRFDKARKKNLLFVCNFTPVERPDYRVGVPKKKQYRLVLDSDAAEFGGSGVEKPTVYKARGRRVRRSAVLDRLSAFGVWSGCV